MNGMLLRLIRILKVPIVLLFLGGLCANLCAFAVTMFYPMASFISGSFPKLMMAFMCDFRAFPKVSFSR